MSNKKCYGAITVSYIFEIGMLEWHLLLTLSRRLRLQRERESAPVCLPIPSGLGFSEFGGDVFGYTLL